ncbi:MAG TPA: thioredoxin [Clostridia bacterium]|nr:thioredoxin [Clostridia bacterium]
MIKHINNKSDFVDATASGTVLVDFYANWCGPCKMLAPVLEQFANDMPNVQVVKVDVDVVSDVAKEFGVVSIPTLILCKEGEIVDKQVGFMNINQLKAFVK